MKEMIRINIALDFNHSANDYGEAIGMKPGGREALVKKLAVIHGRTSKKSEFVKEVLKSGELSGPEKIFGISKLEVMPVLALMVGETSTKKSEGKRW